MPVYNDPCGAIAAVLYPQLVPALTATEPLPARCPQHAGANDEMTPPGLAVVADPVQDVEPPDSSCGPSDPYAEIYASQVAQWKRIVGELHEVRDWGADPLLHALDAARRRRAEAEEDICLLITLGREFTAPRPYDVSALARASGMSEYLVRRCYSGQDIESVQQITGLAPRTLAADPDERVASC
ncbi:hypothetical protein ACFVYD_32025 [Streptomyces sp. NPDC058301]|uniref:hypothetical protein n=1 Tax=Streptomyces sp. NPDC058301 TaxID=3346436 RepID=UPI0036E074E1